MASFHTTSCGGISDVGRVSSSSEPFAPLFSAAKSWFIEPRELSGPGVWGGAWERKCTRTGAPVCRRRCWCAGEHRLSGMRQESNIYVKQTSCVRYMGVPYVVQWYVACCGHCGRKSILEKGKMHKKPNRINNRTNDQDIILWPRTRHSALF